MEEIWKDILGSNSLYQVSSVGRVRSMNRSNGWRMISSYTDRFGYKLVNIRSNRCKIKDRLVHRIMMVSFFGESDLQVNHKNGIKADNRLENLEWCTASENILHRYRILRNVGGNRKKIVQTTKEGDIINTFETGRSASKFLGLSVAEISRLCNGKARQKGFILKFC